MECESCDVYRLPNGIVLAEQKDFYILKTPFEYAEVELQYDAFVLDDYWTLDKGFISEINLENKNVRGRYEDTKITFRLNDTYVNLRYADGNREMMTEGWKTGMLWMREGVKYTMYVPSALAYGSAGSVSEGKPDIPADTIMVYRMKITPNSVSDWNMFSNLVTTTTPTMPVITCHDWHWVNQSAHWCTNDASCEIYAPLGAALLFAIPLLGFLICCAAQCCCCAPPPTPRAIIVEGVPPPVADPALALAAKMLKGTKKDLAYIKVQREEERAKADQLQAKIERLKEEGLGVFKGVSRRGSIKVALSKADGAKLGIKMVQDAKEGIVVQGVTAGGQAEGKVYQGSVLRSINGKDVQNMPFKEATKLISGSDDVVTFTFSPTKENEAATAAAAAAAAASGSGDGGNGSIAILPGKASAGRGGARPIFNLGGLDAADASTDGPAANLNPTRMSQNKGALEGSGRKRIAREPSESMKMGFATEEQAEGEAAGRKHIVSQVGDGGPAWRAGIKAGDEIVIMASHPAYTLTHDELLDAIGKAGTDFHILIDRPGARSGTKTVVRKVSAGGTRHVLRKDGESMGMSFVTDAAGHTVASIKDGGPASRAGFKIGDIIEKVGKDATVQVAKQEGESMGMGFATDDGVHTVTSVQEGLAAFRAGIRVGMVLMEVAGNETGDLTHEQLLETIVNAGAQFAIEVEGRETDELEHDALLEMIVAAGNQFDVEVGKVPEPLGMGFVTEGTQHVVSAIKEGGPAWKAGIREGDFLVKFKGKDTYGYEHEALLNAIMSNTAGFVVDIQEPGDNYVTVNRWPWNAPLGMGFVTDKGKHTISQVGEGSPADDAGLMIGDDIVKIGGVATAGMEHEELLASLVTAGAQFSLEIESARLAGGGLQAAKKAAREMKIQEQYMAVEQLVEEKKVTLKKEDGKSLGFTLTKDPKSDYIIINKVTPGTEADGKLRPGDRLSHVSGVNIKGQVVKDVGLLVKGAHNTLEMLVLGNINDVIADDDSSDDSDAEGGGGGGDAQSSSESEDGEMSD